MRVEVAAEVETELPPEQVMEALLDFTDRRPELWPNLDGNYFEVHEVHATSAVVTEGNIGRPKMWAKEHYDWSTPGTVEWRSSESNYSKPGGGIVVTVTPKSEGGSVVAMQYEREALNWRGRIAVTLVKLGGERMFRSGMKRNLRHIAKVLSATDG